MLSVKTPKKGAQSVVFAKNMSKSQGKDTSKKLGKKATVVFAIMIVAIVAAAAIFIFWGTKSACASVNERVGGVIYALDQESKSASVRNFDLSAGGGFPANGKVSILASVPFDGSDYRVVALDDYCFVECGALTSIDIPAGVTMIGDFAFSGCTALESVSLPDTVNIMSPRCFQSCSALKNVSIPNNVSVLGADTFNGCSSLTAVTLPNKLTSIGYCCFANCGTLSSITIPKSVTTLGESCFSNCASLAEVVFEGADIVQCHRSAFSSGAFSSGAFGNGVLNNGVLSNVCAGRKYIFENKVPKVLPAVRGVSSKNIYFRVKFVDGTGVVLKQVDVAKKSCPYSGVVPPVSVAAHPVTGAAFKAWSSNAYRKITDSGATIVAKYARGAANGGANSGALPSNDPNNAVPPNNNGNAHTLSAQALTAARQNLALAGITWNRLAGGVALKTMQKIVNKGWDSSHWAIIATTNGYQDALSATALAGLLDDAPVLMTNPTQLSAQTAELLVTKNVQNAIIIGGTSAVSNSVEAQVKAIVGNDNVERLAGGTATSTALEVYKLGKDLGAIGSTTWGTDAIVATCDSFQDALSIAPYAYAKHAPILLTDRGTKDIRGSVAGAIASGGFNRTLIVGGTGAVSGAVDVKVAGAKRLAGGSAYTTSKEIANFALSQGMSAANLGIACGTNYQDALVGAPFLGKLGSIIVLADNKNSTTVNSVVAKHKFQLGECYIFGGTSAVSEAVENKIVAASA